MNHSGAAVSFCLGPSPAQASIIACARCLRRFHPGWSPLSTVVGNPTLNDALADAEGAQEKGTTALAFHGL